MHSKLSDNMMWEDLNHAQKAFMFRTRRRSSAEQKEKDTLSKLSSVLKGDFLSCCSRWTKDSILLAFCTLCERNMAYHMRILNVLSSYITD